MIQIVTKDGTKTFFSEEFQENYHSLIGAETESLQKFIHPSKVLEQKEIFLIDIGFGLGYNSLTLIENAKKKGIPLFIQAFELYEKTIEGAISIHNSENQAILKSLLRHGIYEEYNLRIQLFLGDARKEILKLANHSMDCVFLDPFSPPKNPELWTVEFIKKLSVKLKHHGKILTYSSSLAIIKALIKNGFYVGYTEPVGRKRGGILASKNREEIFFPLTEEDLFLLSVSVHGIPNSDKNYWNSLEIKEYRQKIADISVEKKIRIPHKKAVKLYER